MKYVLLTGVLFWSLLSVSSSQIESRVYKVEELKNGEGLSGETVHLNSLSFVLNTMTLNDETNIQSIEDETLLIVKEGELSIKLNDSEQVVGPGSIALVLANDEAKISASSELVEYYQMNYISKSNKESDHPEGLRSMIIDFDELEYHEHDKGGIREYFNSSTPLLNYFEMHVTNLNGNIKSREPHTHGAAEFVLMIKGHTQMEIGDELYQANEGDLYFLESQVPHAIENLEDEQCMYFAFQWES